MYNSWTSSELRNRLAILRAQKAYLQRAGASTRGTINNMQRVTAELRRRAEQRRK